MRFNRVPAPESSKYIRLPEKGSVVETFVVLPPLSFFMQESRYWKTAHATADKSGDAFGRTMAENIRKSLRQVIVHGVSVHAMADGVLPLNRDEGGYWYAKATAVMAYSRLWRQMFEVQTEEASSDGLLFGARADELDLVADFDDNVPSSTAVHSGDEILSALFDIERPNPGDEVWLEGESVYVRASWPARPTPHLEKSFNAFYDSSFPAHEFTTLNPHLKTDVWPTI